MLRTLSGGVSLSGGGEAGSAALGVGAGGFNDEWDAVGLARHTDTKDW